MVGNIADNMADESRSWKINWSRVSYPFCEWERRLALIQIYCHLRAGARRSNTGIMLTQARGIYTKLEVICRGRAQTPSTIAIAVDSLSATTTLPHVTSYRTCVWPCIPKLSGNDLLEGRNSLARAIYLEICSRVGRFLIYGVDR